MKNVKQIFIIVTLFIVLGSVSFAIQLSPVITDTASSSRLSSSWAPYKANDNNNNTAWSSKYHSGQFGYEWFAFWWQSAQQVDVIKIKPRIYNGTPICIPEYVNIYIANANGEWQFCTWTPLDGTAQELTILLPQGTTTNGILLTTDRLRDDTLGGYYFQIAEIKVKKY